jgi:hypothetical protein
LNLENTNVLAVDGIESFYVMFEEVLKNEENYQKLLLKDGIDAKIPANIKVGEIYLVNWNGEWSMKSLTLTK